MRYTDEYGNEYESYQAAIDAGVEVPIPINTAAPARANTVSTTGANTGSASTTVANIPTYGYELQRLMQQYGVNAPVAPRTTDQNLINQYFNQLRTPMYQTPSGNGLFNQYLNMGLGKIASPFGDMTRFFPGQAVAPAGFRYDPVTNTNVNVTDPAGAASGRITTGTPNIGGNQCPPNFNFDPVSGSCVPTIDTGLLTGGQSQSAQQPMPTCPPNTTLDPVNRICIPKSCPAGYEMDASGNCVAIYTQTPCPPGFTRDASGVCIPPRVPECPPNTVKDQVTGQCVPTSCPAGYEKDATGNCVAKSMQVPCPTGFTRDSTGVCVPVPPVVTPPPPPVVPPPPPVPCQSGYVRSATGECVPDPEQLAFFNKHYQTPHAGEYDIYNAIAKGSLSENLVRDLVSQRGGENVDDWMAKNVDPDKTFSAYAIQNLAAQGRPDDPNIANQGTQSGENRVFDLYQQGAIGLDEIEDAMGRENVIDWMRAYRPDTYQQVYAQAPVVTPPVVAPPVVAPPVVAPPVVNVQPANAVFDDVSEQQNMVVYNQARSSGMTAEQVSAQYGIPLSEINDWMGLRGLSLAGSAQTQASQPATYTAAEQEVLTPYNRAPASVNKTLSAVDRILVDSYGYKDNGDGTVTSPWAVSRASGGLIKGRARYAKGGSVGFDNMMRKYQVGGLNQFNSMLGQAPAARPAMIGQPPMRDEGLDQMVQRYNVGRSSNTRQDYDQASEKLKRAMMSASEAVPAATGPSKAEMYFRLASAFAKPTPTGNFFESLGNAGGELAAIGSERRAEASADAAMRRDLAIELAKADVTRARDIMEMESESGLPLSPEGKSAYDEGLVPGTPEFAIRVRQLQAEEAARKTAAGAAPTRMSTTEARAKLDSEREVLQSEIAINAITKAIALSPIAYTKSVGDQISRRRTRLTDPSNERVVATSLMEQLMTTNVLSSLRAMFGGNVTEGERAIALATQGFNEESSEARTAIFQELLDIANKRNSYLTSLLQRINTREFMQYDDAVAPESTELTAGQETGVI